MDRATALAITLICFVLFAVLLYYAARIKLNSSLALASLSSLILLNFFYPVNQLIYDEASFTLVFYVLLQGFFIFYLFFYIGSKSLMDERIESKV